MDAEHVLNEFLAQVQRMRAKQKQYAKEPTATVRNELRDLERRVDARMVELSGKQQNLFEHQE